MSPDSRYHLAGAVAQRHQWCTRGRNRCNEGRMVHVSQWWYVETAYNAISEKKLLLSNNTFCMVSIRQVQIQDNVTPLIPCFSLLIRIVWSIVSKAFLRSMNTPAVYWPLSMDDVIFFTISISARDVEWLLWKPLTITHKFVLISIKSTVSYYKLYHSLFLLSWLNLGQHLWNNH